MPITVTLTPGEFATFVDCTPAVYNKLTPEAQRAVSDMRNTSEFYDAVDKMVFEAERFFGTPESLFSVAKDETPIKVGNTIKVTGRLNPNYLLGWTFEVVKVNAKTVAIKVPDEPQYRRFAGNAHVRIPKVAVTKM